MTSTVASSITKPIKSQLASTAFSKSQWQSMAVKWQVSAESRWKNSEEKLSSSLKISRKHADQISNMKVENEMIVTDTDLIWRENKSLVLTLDRVELGVKTLSQHISKVGSEISAQRNLKKEFQSSDLETDEATKDLHARFISLSLSMTKKTDQIESLAKSKTDQLKSGKESLHLGERDIICQFERLVSALKEINEMGQKIDSEIREKEISSKRLEENVDLLVGNLVQASAEFDSTKDDFRLIDCDFADECQKLDERELLILEPLETGLKVQTKLESGEGEVSNIEESLENEIFEIKTSLGQSEDLLIEVLSNEKKIKDEISTTTREADGLRIDLQEIKRTTKDISNLRNSLVKSEDERMTAAKRLEELSEIENHKGQLDEHNMKLCQEIHSLEASVSSKMMEISEIQDTVKLKDLEFEESDQTLESLTSQESVTLKEIAKMKRSHDNVVIASARISEKIRFVETKISKNVSLPNYQLKLEEARKTLTGLKRESDQLNLLEKKGNETVALSEKQTEDLKANLTSHINLVEKLEERIQSASDQGNKKLVSDKALKSKLKSLETKLKKFERDEKSLGKEIDSKDVEKEKLEKEMVGIGDELKSKEKDRIEIEESIIQVKNSLFYLESNAKIAEESLKKQLQVKKKFEKDLSKEKQLMIGAKRNMEKMSKQFEKSSEDKGEVDRLKGEKVKTLEEVLKLKNSLNLKLSTVEDELANNEDKSQKDGQNLKLTESVLKKFEKEKAKVETELKASVQEYNGILICRNSENNDSFKNLTIDVQKVKTQEELMYCQLQKALTDLLRMEKSVNLVEETSALEGKKSFLQELEKHLKEREQEGAKLNTKLDSLKQTDSPAPNSKFFKTPRSIFNYRSSTMPSPRKKMAKDSKRSPATSAKGDSEVFDATVPLTPKR